VRDNGTANDPPTCLPLPHQPALRGAAATPEEFARAADAELARSSPLPRNAFKAPLLRNVLVRTLTDLAEPAEPAGFAESEPVETP
ncbi:hypothetical protein ABZW82_25450, partial [Streptosporangium sandarakinum]